MLALPVPVVFAASEATPNSLLTGIVVIAAMIVLVTIALDLRKLRRASRLRAVHSVLGAAFSVIVVGGALALSMALGSAPSATADQPATPTSWPVPMPEPPVPVPEPTVPVPEPTGTSDVTDPSTDIQLPTLSVE